MVRTQVQAVKSDLRRYLNYIGGGAEPPYGLELFENLVEAAREGASKSELDELTETCPRNTRDLAQYDARRIPIIIEELSERK